MKEYKLIIMDLDGTLVDTAPDIMRVANQVLQSRNLAERNLSEVKAVIGRGVHELLLQLALPHKFEDGALEEAVKMFRALYGESCVDESRAYPGVEEVLAGPLRGMKLAVVTNKPHDLSEKILKSLKLEQYFKIVIGTGVGFPAKPDPTAMQHVLKTLNCPAGDAVMVGDSSVDRETCQRAGVDFVWMTYGYENLHGQTGFQTMHQASQWSDLTE